MQNPEPAPNLTQINEQIQYDKKSNPNKKIIALVIGILLVLASIAIYVYVTNSIDLSNQSSIENLSEPQDILPTTKTFSINIEKNNDPSLVAFGKDLKDVTLYNLNSKTSTKISSLINDTSIVSTRLGTWSNDASYLPLISTQSEDEIGIISTLYFYDSNLKTIIKSIDSNQDQRVKFGMSGFGSFGHEGRWVNQDAILYYLDDKCLTVTISGVTNEYLSDECKSVLRNSEIDYYFDRTGTVDASFLYKGTALDYLPKGTIIGTYKNQLITIQTIERKLGSGKSIDPSRKIVFNEINSGKFVKEIDIKSDWYYLTSQLVPHSNLLILHMRDKSSRHTQEKFILVDLETSLEKDLLTIKPDPFVVSPTMDTLGTFQVTANGEWLVYKDVIEPHRNENIKAINLKTNETLSLCDGVCLDYKVYNPYKMDLGVRLFEN